MKVRCLFPECTRAAGRREGPDVQSGQNTPYRQSHFLFPVEVLGQLSSASVGASPERAGPSVPGGGTFLFRCKHSFIGQEGSSSHSSSIISHKARLWEESDGFRTTKRRKREKEGEEGKMTVLKGVASSNRFVAVRLFFYIFRGSCRGRCLLKTGWF